MTITLPAPVITTPRYGFGGKSRTRDVTYLIDGTEVATEGRTERMAVQISVGHSKDNKSFYARANQVTLRVETLGTSTSFFPFDGVTLARQPVARYSDKALEAFLADVVANFPAQVATEPKLQAMFTDLKVRP